MATKKFKSDVSLEQGISLPNKPASRALIIDGSGNLVESAVTSAELGHMSGVTSAVQTQMDAKADLVAGKIPTSQLPALAITEVFTAATIAARDLLTIGAGDGEVQEGDVVIVTDASADAAITSGSASYIYNGSSYSLLKAGDEVLSVNGETGIVTLNSTHLNHTQSTPANWTVADASSMAAHLDEVGSRIKAIEDDPESITAGAGLTRTVDDLSLNVDASTLEINVDTLRVKASGITENELNNVDGGIDADSFVLPTGYTAGAGTVAAADSITAAIQKIDGNVTAATHDAMTLGGIASDTTDDTLDLTGQVLTVNAVTTTTDGAMLAADKLKLDAITGTNTGDEVAATDELAGIVELATIAEINLGTDTERAITPAGLKGSALDAAVVLNTAKLTADSINVDSAGAVMNTDATTAEMDFVIDEDTMVSDSATKIPTQQSVKAYVDAAIGVIGTGSDGDLDEASFLGAADTATNLNVNGLMFQNAVVRSFDAHISVLVDATADLYESFRLMGIQKGTSWDMSVEATGDDSKVTFSITNAGQVQYSKTTTAGWASTTIKFRAITTSV
jgi:hypothetical protein